MRLRTFNLALALAAFQAAADDRPSEIHDRIASGGGSSNRIALTLDACSGQFDEDLFDVPSLNTRKP